MSVATSTAIAIAATAASAGSSIAAAKMQSNAAKKAAEAQQAGTDKALGVQQSANAPYLALGQQGAQRLAQRQFEPYTQQFQPRGAQMPGQPPPQANSGFQAFQPGGQSQMPTLGSIGQPGMPGSPDQQRAMLNDVRAGQGQPGPGMEQMATVQAPTGEVARIPVGPMLEQALARGAKRMA